MYGMLFQVVVKSVLVIDDQLVNRDVYLERRKQRKEEYKNMNEYEKYKHGVRTMLKGAHT